jgi:CMP-N-acetylneuraminic acid synthetase
MKTVAIIPIRSGSKRFPGKNFSKFNETTLIENTIDKLLRARIDNIIITTDTLEKVHNLIYNPNTYLNNITIIHRPKSLAQDRSKVEDVILHAIEKIERIIPVEEDYIIILAQVTSPNWSPHVLTYALQRFEDKKVDSVISVSPNYMPNGCFYIIKKSTFLLYKKLFLLNMYLVKLDWEDSIDIDYEYQLHIAEALSRGNHDE